MSKSRKKITFKMKLASILINGFTFILNETFDLVKFFP